jgi:hypothetical protein
MAGANLLSNEALAQVREVVRQITGDVRGTRATNMPPIAPGPECFLGYFAGGCTAMAGSTPGYGTADLYRMGPTGDVEALLLSDGATANTRTVYNASGTAVGAAAYSPVWRDKLGTWWVAPWGGGSSSMNGFYVYTIFNAPRPTQPSATPRSIYSSADDWFTVGTAGFEYEETAEATPRRWFVCTAAGNYRFQCSVDCSSAAITASSSNLTMYHISAADVGTQINLWSVQGSSVAETWSAITFGWASFAVGDRMQVTLIATVSTGDITYGRTAVECLKL